ncbi:MAG TPA: type II toxin-antitoxin system RelE/ParE family toxin [Nitrospiraceae bacterium]|nr:type II toxin-antitoxin system RelE/ParE family toxin [Nitrospiraceae bacterium]
MAKIIWTGPALKDLEVIARYIAVDSPRYAERFAKRLVRAPKVLKRHPQLGRVVPEFNRACTRELIYASYRIVYEIRDTDCFITAVIHASRDLMRHYSPGEWDITDQPLS